MLFGFVRMPIRPGETDWQSFDTWTYCLATAGDAHSDNSQGGVLETAAARHIYH